jgi:hypothetical protein
VIIPNEIAASSMSVSGAVAFTTPPRKRAKHNEEEFLEYTKLFQADVKTSFAELAKSSADLAKNVQP